MQSLTRSSATLLLLLAQPVAAAQWDLIKQADGVAVYTREVSGSNLRAFKGVAVFPASLGTVLGILDNVAECTSWMLRCRSGVLLEEDGFFRRYIYQEIQLPFPARDRDLVSEVILSWDAPRRTFLISQSAAPDRIPLTELIRIRRADGYFRLVELKPDEVELTWEQWVEPGGYLPAFIVNSMTVDLPFKSLKNIRALAQTDRYRSVVLVTNEDGNPIGLDGTSW